MISYIKALDIRVTQQDEQIRLLINGKKSGSSNTLPSRQIGRTNKKNLRVKSGRKSGGQRTGICDGRARILVC